jgi:hypothetical protein
MLGNPELDPDLKVLIERVDSIRELKVLTECVDTVLREAAGLLADLQLSRAHRMQLAGSDLRIRRRLDQEH